MGVDVFRVLWRCRSRAGGDRLHYLTSFGQELSAGRGKARWTLHVMCTVVSQAAAVQHMLSGISVVKSHMHKAFAIHILICMQQLRHKPELHINALRMWLREEKSTVIRLSSLQNNNYILVFTGCEWWRIRQIVNDDEYEFFCWSFPLKTVQHLMMPCSLWCLQTESGEYLMCCWLNSLCMCRCRKAFTRQWLWSWTCRADTFIMVQALE